MQFVKTILIASLFLIASGSLIAVPVGTHQDNSASGTFQEIENHRGSSIDALSYHATSGHSTSDLVTPRYGDDFEGSYGGNTRTRSGSTAAMVIQPMEPVPEPATIFLLGIGLVCAAGVRRYRLKQA
ncbi:MAG: PEP-CTERM sorting domain-containing protein [Candidatus Zixiibacteriota bacterium]|nr:MAG: PEP-CTERM sorting domain-containing protein [candidate division Zixibacteria bacterium]